MLASISLAALVLASALPSSAGPTERAPAISSSLKQCLSDSGAQLVYPGDSNYNSLAQAENDILKISPSVIALPKHDKTAGRILACVNAEGGSQKIAPRGGGHSYEGYGLGGADGYVVVDLQKMNTITVDNDNKQATVGAGVRLGALAQTLADQGFALPHGTCPYVGVAGHGLGGGFGYATRWGGFLLDRIVSMQVAKVDGSIVTASASDNSDLFWALRGAGANNFGTVTSFTYSLLDAPTQIVGFSYVYNNADDCVSALLGLQQLTAQEGGLPAEMTGELLWYASDGDDAGACSFSGQHVKATKKQHSAAFKKLSDAAGVQPASSDVKSFSSWSDALLDVMGSFDVSNVNGNHEPYYAKSLMTPAGVTYTRSTAKALFNKLAGYQGIEGVGASISFGMLGPDSHSAKVDASQSSYPHRGYLFLSQYYAYGMPASNSKGQQTKVWNAFADMIDTAKKASPDAAWGAYSNYVDAQLKTWASDYYGSSLDRLKSLKKKYDPKNIFDYAQGLSRA